MVPQAADLARVNPSENRSPAPRPFDRQFRIAMAARNTNAAAIARRFGWAPNTVGNWATDDPARQTFPRASDLLVLCDHLGVSADFLLGRTDEMGGSPLAAGLLLIDEAHVERAKTSRRRLRIEGVRVPQRFRLVTDAQLDALQKEIDEARKPRREG